MSEIIIVRSQDQFQKVASGCAEEITSGLRRECVAQSIGSLLNWVIDPRYQLDALVFLKDPEVHRPKEALRLVLVSGCNTTERLTARLEEFSCALKRSGIPLVRDFSQMGRGGVPWKEILRIYQMPSTLTLVSFLVFDRVER